MGNVLNQQGPFTVSAWAYLAATFSTNYMGIVGKWSDSNPRNFLLCFGSTGTTNGATFFINTGGGTTKTCTSSQALSTFVGKWTFLSATMNTTSPGTMTLYVNGVLSTTTSSVGTSLQADSNNFRIGAHNTLSTSSFGGMIDSASLFNSAFTAQQHAQLYLEELQNCPTTLNYTRRPQRYAINSTGPVTPTDLSWLPPSYVFDEDYEYNYIVGTTPRVVMPINPTSQ
jgi:hypothetical protein